MERELLGDLGVVGRRAPLSKYVGNEQYMEM
jgi:hypothetical protein